jgi:hypothetical protein
MLTAFARNTLLTLFASVLVLVMSGDILAQSPWRTHYVKRDGLFHVERYRTGNGITPNGSLVLTNAFDAFAPVVSAALSAGTKEAPGDGTIRSVNWQDDYLKELKRADDLLERANRLLEGRLPVNQASSPHSPSSQEELKKQFGENPWTKKRPQ